MELHNFMDEYFPSLNLSPGLFYNWEIAIRFELGIDLDKEKYPYSNYLRGVYERAIVLFESLHSEQDELYVVIDMYGNGNRKTYKQRRQLFIPFIYDKKQLFKLKHQEFPFSEMEGKEDTNSVHRFMLKCKINELKYIPLLKAICNYDLGVEPRMFHRVYFINMEKKTIFHIYDDRGCGLLATSPKTIVDLYKKHNEWILDYDREEIDRAFHKEQSD